MQLGFFETTQRFLTRLKEKFSHLFTTKNATSTQPVAINATQQNINTNALDQEALDLQEAIALSKITHMQEEKTRARTQEAHDSALAKKLQQDEDRIVALQLQQEEERKNQILRKKQLVEDEALARKLAQEDAGISHQVQQSSQEHFFNQSFVLPASLQGKAIYHLKALSQKSGTSCGYHTILNAQAIEKIVTAKQTPNAQDIQAATKELLKIEGFLDEESLKMFELGQEQAFFSKIKSQLQNTYFIKYNTYNTDDVISLAEVATHNPLGLFYEALSKIKTVGYPLTVHLPFFLGNSKSGHWVYIGIIKEINKKPYLVYLDSCNSRIMEGSPQEKVLNRVYELIQ